MKLRIGGVPEHFNYFWQLPSTREEFRNHGFYYDWIDYPGGTGAMSLALENDEVDMAIMLTEGAIAAVSMGKKLKIHFPLVMSPLLWGVFVSARRKDPLPNHYAQGKFAISRLYSGSHLMAMFLAQRDNSTLNDLNFVVSRDLMGAKNALLNGDADYFLWEKYMTQPLVRSGDFRMINEIGAPWPAFVFVTRDTFNLVETEILQEMVYTCTSDYLLENKNDLISGISGTYGLTEDDAKAWLNEVKYYDGNQYWKDRLTAAVIIMHSKGMIHKEPTLEDLLFKPN